MKTIINLSLCLITLTLASCASDTHFASRHVAGYETESAEPQPDTVAKVPTGSARFERMSNY